MRTVSFYRYVQRAFPKRYGEVIIVQFMDMMCVNLELRHYRPRATKRPAAADDEPLDLLDSAQPPSIQHVHLSTGCAGAAAVTYASVTNLTSPDRSWIGGHDAG